MCTYFKTNWCNSKSDRWFFSNFDCQKILPYKGFLSQKKCRGTGLLSGKTEALHAELNERAEEATSSYSAAVDFLQYIYWVPEGKNQDPINMFSLWIFFHRYFLTILIMGTEQLCWREVLCGCFRLIWLWLLLAIMKRCVERCALQLYRTLLKVLNFC